MKTLAVNGQYSLVYFPNRVNRYAVFHTTRMSPSNDLKLNTMVAQSSILSKKLKSYFTTFQITQAVNKVHDMDYVSRKFKA